MQMLQFAESARRSMLNAFQEGVLLNVSLSSIAAARSILSESGQLAIGNLLFKKYWDDEIHFKKLLSYGVKMTFQWRFALAVPYAPHLEALQSTRIVAAEACCWYRSVPFSDLSPLPSFRTSAAWIAAHV